MILANANMEYFLFGFLVGITVFQVFKEIFKMLFDEKINSGRK